MGEDKIKMNLGSRVGQVVVDHVIYALLLFVLFVVAVISFEMQRGGGYAFQALTAVIFSMLYFCKDILAGGQSPAKHLFHLCVVDYKTLEKIDPVRGMLRNLTLIVWPLEWIVLFFSPKRRLGDLLAGTCVVHEYDVVDMHAKSSIGNVLLALSLSFAFSLLTIYSSILLLFPEFRSVEDPDSYNPVLSKQVELFLEEHLEDDIDSCYVKIYDRSRNDSLKYAYIDLFLKYEGPFFYQEDMMIAHKMLRDTLQLAIPIKDYCAKCSFRFEAPYHSFESKAFFNFRQMYLEEQRYGQRTALSKNEVVFHKTYPNGTLEAVTSFRKGRKHGICRCWYPNGQLKSETEYDKGIVKGVAKKWNKDGTPIE